VRPQLEFVPLFFLGYSVLQTRRRIKTFLVLLLAIAAANGVAGLVQFELSPSQLASWGAGYSQKVYGTNGLSGRVFLDSSGETHVRPFALGSDEGFGGSIGVFALPAAFALLSLAGNRRLKIAAGVLSAGAVLGIVTSQSRTHILGGVIVIIAFMLLATSSRRAFRLLAGLGVGVAIGMIAISALASGASSGLFDRYNSIAPSSALSTTYNYRSTTWSVVLPTYLEKYPLGAGIGRTGPASSAFGESGGGGGGLDAESEATYLVLDIGIPGLIVLLGFQVRMCVLSLRVRRLKDIELRLLLAALAAPLFTMIVRTWVGITTATTPNGPYLWFIAGALAYWLIDAQRKRGIARDTA
jgi:O-antigen ligase